VLRVPFDSPVQETTSTCGINQVIFVEDKMCFL